MAAGHLQPLCMLHDLVYLCLHICVFGHVTARAWAALKAFPQAVFMRIPEHMWCSGTDDRAEILYSGLGQAQRVDLPTILISQAIMSGKS